MPALSQDVTSPQPYPERSLRVGTSPCSSDNDDQPVRSNPFKELRDQLRADFEKAEATLEEY